MKSFEKYLAESWIDIYQNDPRLKEFKTNTKRNWLEFFPSKSKYGVAIWYNQEYKSWVTFIVDKQGNQALDTNSDYTKGNTKKELKQMALGTIDSFLKKQNEKV